MTLIRIVSGAYGMNVNGRIVVVRREQTCEVPEEEAARLVKLGVAVYVKEPVLMAEATPEPVSEAAPSDTPDEEENEAPEESLEEMPFDQLKQMAKDAGLPVGKLRSRKNIIDALQNMEDGDKPPSMEAGDVVL